VCVRERERERERRKKWKAKFPSLTSEALSKCARDQKEPKNVKNIILSLFS